MSGLQGGENYKTAEAGAMGEGELLTAWWAV